MAGKSMSSALMKPLVVLALPGMYLVYKINEFKRHQQEVNRRKVTERELANLNSKIDKLLNKLDEHEPELAGSQDEECVICVGAKATMQTFPCGHRVVCRKCFVKTIQMAVCQRMLPLRCVICRTKIIRLKQTTGGFATPATHTPHLANTRACLLRQPGLIDAEGFNRSPFLSAEEFENPPPIKPYSRQDCRFHKHWKNKVAAAPFPQDVDELLIVPGAEKLRPSSAKDDRRKRLSHKVADNASCLPTPPRKKDVKRLPGLSNQPLSPTIIVENFKTPLKEKCVIQQQQQQQQQQQRQQQRQQQQQQQPLKDNKRSARLEGVAKDRRRMNSIVDNELEMVPLIRSIRPPSPIKRRGSKTSTGSTAFTPEISITAPEDDDDDDDEDEETHLIITTQPIKKLEFHTERFSLPSIPPPKLTLIDPRKGDRQLSILDNAIDEEDELLLSSFDNSANLVTEAKTVNVIAPTAEVRIAPPPSFRRRSPRMAAEPRLQKPTTRFEKFKHYHVRQPLPLFPIPEKEETQESFELRDAQAFYKIEDKLAASQTIPLISTESMITVGGSFLNSATRTKMALLSSFRQLRSKSPLKAFGIRSRKTVAPLLATAELSLNM